MGVRRNAVKRFSAISKSEAKLVDKIASFDKELSKPSDGSLTTRTYRMNVSRLRAIVHKELNDLREKKTSCAEILSKYNENDEKILRERELYWGA
jgi:hypothetical protein